MEHLLLISPIRQLLNHYLQGNNISNKSGQINPLYLTGRHFPSFYTNENTKWKNPFTNFCESCVQKMTEEANRDKVFVMLAYVSNNITPNTIINSYYYDIIIFCDVI